MIEIRVHGRGGQGAVVASKALAIAVANEGKFVQSFPEFGVERRGAPVYAFTRIDDKEIFVRSKIYEPDHVLVLDPTLIEAIDVTEGLKKGGWILINTTKKPNDFPHLAKDYSVATVDAYKIANKYGLGSKASPIVNTAILGAFSKITGIISLELIMEGIKEIVPIKPQENADAAKEAYNSVNFEKQNSH
ncbi:MAG: pyruvate ferredoxin oxidoreductase [Candidatus Cloacimonadota bacterium]|nr:MAG: pyruvate ferredoxin oxidoreductase [Candidatus Cloacimonadota bacterium]